MIFHGKNTDFHKLTVPLYSCFVFIQKMPLEGSYAVWNNRGGSGKTNLTYHLAIKYAYRNPDKTVLVVDMCPQADLSHAFLGMSQKRVDS